MTASTRSVTTRTSRKSVLILMMIQARLHPSRRRRLLVEGAVETLVLLVEQEQV